MQTIPIITVFDTEKILLSGKSSDSGRPVKAGKDSLYMVVTEDNLAGGQASADLIVDTQVGDILQWRATSLSGNRSQPVVFTNFQADVSDIITQPQPGKLILSEEEATEEEAIKGFFGNSISAYWTAEVIGAGSSPYTVFFTIRYVDEDGHPALSYYFWESDPAEAA